MTKELFIEAVRQTGEFAGVFEYDGEVGYFYLFRLPNDHEGGKIEGSIEIINGELTFNPSDLEIRWSDDLYRVGLFIRQEIWALFNLKSGQTFGQLHSKNLLANVPKDQIFD